MYCKDCGKEIADGAKYCEHCGAQLEQDAEQEEKGSFVGGCLMWCIWAVVLLTGLIWVLQACSMFI